MTIKRRFLMSGIWVFLIPVIGVIITAAVLMTWYFVSDPARMMYMFGGGEILFDPMFRTLIIIWAVISVIITIISSICVVARLSDALLEPLGELKKAADNIKSGELDFEIMTSKYEELNELCTAFESMRKRLQEMALIQEDYERERSQLIANISHDLRTPITSIKGYAQGIMENVADTPEKKERYVVTIYQKALILEELAMSMSEFAKYEMRRIHYDFQVSDIAAFTRDVAQECSLDLEADGIKIYYSLPEKKLPVLLDKGKMHRVFANVVSNAVKYKRDDSSLLQLNMEEMQDGICISIADNGMGIDKDDVRRVFEGHFRGDPSRTSRVKGQGLGLSIAKQIVEAHKGKIWLKSEAEAGPCVYIYLPLCDSDEDLTADLVV